MLLERAGELKRFERLLAAAEAGRGETVLVRGPAGIGKTALVNALAAAAAGKGFSVLRARGRPLEREVPFGVAHQLLDPVLRRATQAERDRLLAGAALVGARALGLWGGDSPPDRFAGIHGMYWLSANLAEREVLVMVVDDLQWADDTSLEWLGYLAARCTELRLLLAVTVLEGHAGEPQAVGALGGEALPVSLLPLSANGVETLIRAALDEQAETAFCVACHELTGGNPLFVRELLAAIRDEGFSARLENVPLLHSVAPSAVGTSVRVRLSQLGDDAIALAHAAAVLGDGTEVAAAAELAGIEPVTAELIADRLAAAQLLAPKRPLEFFHPLISAALYEEMPPGERRVAHRRAAEILDRDRRLAQAVSHLLETGPARDSWVVERLVAAAAAAVDRAAPEIAASYLRRAVAEPPPPDQEARVLLMLGTAEHRAGEPGAIPHLEQALALARDSETRLAAATTLAPAYVARDQTTLALTALERMFEELDDGTGSSHSICWVELLRCPTSTWSRPAQRPRTPSSFSRVWSGSPIRRSNCSCL